MAFIRFKTHAATRRAFECPPVVWSDTCRKIVFGYTRTGTNSFFDASLGITHLDIKTCSDELRINLIKSKYGLCNWDGKSGGFIVEEPRIINHTYFDKTLACKLRT